MMLSDVHLRAYKYWPHSELCALRPSLPYDAALRPAAIVGQCKVRPCEFQY